ncbi:MAG: NosD domain-containing protein [Halobacteriota archaeon]|jgi:parallel beta-helix repeat protein
MEAKQVIQLVAVCIILAACVTTAIPRAAAAEIRVGSGGQYRTISEAVKSAQPGDTVLVGPGTYVENIVVDKPVKVVSTNGESATVVKAADTGKDVFLLSGSGITIQGFTVTSGKMGVAFGHTSNCVLTACVVNGNGFGVYLSGATGNLVSNNNLNGNGFGIYLDGSSGNKLSNNSASNEKGGGGNASLSDGIYMFNSNANNVTRCDLSNNQNFGVSLFNSKNNAFSNNTLSSNAQFGVRLRDGANNNQFSFNTFKTNAENGVLIGDSQANTFYFNNFLAEKSNFYTQEGNNINSTKKLNYTYGGNVFSGFVGNYYSNYVGSDADRNGIGDPPVGQDKYPLVKPVENYGMVQPTPTPTASPSAAASTTSTAYANSTVPSAGQRAPAGTPGFETASAMFGLLFAAVIAVILKRMR